MLLSVRSFSLKAVRRFVSSRLCDYPSMRYPIFKNPINIPDGVKINIDGYYGRGLNINEVKCLTIDKYDEEIVDYCIPFFDRNIQGIHHLHQINNFFVTDFCLSKRKI